MGNLKSRKPTSIPKAENGKTREENQEMGNAGSWLSECQKKTATSAAEYAENVTLRYQETALKFQPRTDQSAFISPNDVPGHLQRLTEPKWGMVNGSGKLTTLFRTHEANELLRKSKEKQGL
ncbi:Protein FAM13C, partial [Ophiophagus hannah]